MPAIVTRIKAPFVDAFVGWLFHLGMHIPPCLHILYFQRPTDRTLTATSRKDVLSQRAFESLIATARRSIPVSSLPQLVITTLLQFGAKHDAIARVGVPMPPVARVEHVTEEARHEVLSRVVAIVKAFVQYVFIVMSLPALCSLCVHTSSRNNAVASEDLINLVLSLLPIALEPSTSAELQADIMVTVDILGGCVPSCSNGFSPLVSTTFKCSYVVVLTIFPGT